MYVKKQILNVVLGFVVLLSTLFSYFSIIAIVDKTVPVSSLFMETSMSILIGSLLILYFVNRPRGSTLAHMSFWNRKWVLAIYVFLAIGVAAYSLSLPVVNIIASIAIELPLVGEVPIGLASSFVVFILLLKTGAMVIWRCPSCNGRLPFLIDSNKKNQGLKIKRCPHCNELLSNA